jgi:hypothetical protein
MTTPAGLVRLILGEDKEAQCYASRSGVIALAFDTLQGFVARDA